MKEQISALMDGEFDIDSAEHLVASLKAGNDNTESWCTYHLIGDVMRGAPVFQPDFKQRLMQRLETEPVVLAPQIRQTQGKKTLGSSTIWPIAASIAAVAFVGWVVMQQQVQTGADATPVEIAQNIPSEYLLAHQTVSSSSAAYYIQPAAYSENGK